MKRSLICIALFATVIYCGTTLTSCKKNGDTKAAITVLDTLGLPVDSATVTLWQDTAHNPITGAQSTIRVSAISDISGNATFTFPNEAFLNVWAIKNRDTAFGFIRLVQYQTTPLTVSF